jgi:predicted dehydrogenase
VLGAVSRGVSVVADQPFAPTAAVGQELAEAAECILLNVFHNRRWDTDLVTLRGVLDTRRSGGCSGSTHGSTSTSPKGWSRDPGKPPDAGWAAFPGVAETSEADCADTLWLADHAGRPVSRLRSPARAPACT